MALVSRIVLLICLFSLICTAQTDRVIDEALKPSPVADNLRRLTDEIGGRVPGTPAAQQAVDWGVAAFRAAGVDSVRTEPFQVPATWAEGATRVEVVAPARFTVRAVSAAWTPALPNTRVPVIDVGEGKPEDFARAGDIGGKAVLVHTDVLKSWADLFNEYLKAPLVIEAAIRGRAVAILFLASREHDILYRHTSGLNGRLARIPMLIVAREDGLRISRLLAAKQPVELQLAIPNRIGGPTPAHNVVAEIRGSELPDEWVLLGAHLDSWELGTGALDNGCNAALVIDAARAIKASGIPPRRSIRFVLFNGEEQGMLGSAAYAAAHQQELDRAQAVVIFDTGIGRVTGYSLGGRKDAVAPLQGLLDFLPRFQAAEFTTDAFVGTDNLDFLLHGVPTLVANQEEANYLVNYHATSDTFDKVDIPELKKHVAIAAATVLALANAPSRIAPRQSRAEIEQLMKESGLDSQLKLFGLWEEWQQGARGRKP